MGAARDVRERNVAERFAVAIALVLRLRLLRLL